jgi:hypothetical protein
MDEPESNEKKGNTNTTGNDNSKESLSVPSGDNEEITDPDNSKTNNKQKNWPSRIQAGASIILIFITAFYAYYAQEQVRQMEKAVNEAKEMRKDTNTATSGTLKEMGRQSTAMQEAATANKKTVQLYEQVVKSQQEQFILDQRAWIKIGGVKFKEPFVANKTSIMQILVKNNGKTPAQRTRGHVTVSLKDPSRNLSTFVLKNDREITFPAGDEKTITVRWLPFSQQQIDLLQCSSDPILITEIKFAYFDIYKRPHHTCECFYYQPKSAIDMNLTLCETGCSYMD